MEHVNLALGNASLLALVVLECFLLHFVWKEKIPWKEVITNLNSGHILLWIGRGFEVAAYYYLVKHFSLNLLNSWNAQLLWLFAFVSWDFCFYWMHRYNHVIKLFWSIHSVHHEGEFFNLSLGIRNSWYSSISSLPFFVILAIIGVPFHQFVVVSSIHYFIQFYNHNHLVKKSFWLEYILITPSHHRVHHGKNEPYVDKNFGGTFVFWDKLFGTFQLELEAIPVQFGVNNYQETFDPVKVNNNPVGVYLAGKAWFHRSEPKATPVSNLMLVTGALLLFLLLLCFIHLEDSLIFIERLPLILLLFMGTWGLGAMMEQSVIGKWLYVLGILFPGMIFTFFFQVDFYPFWIGLLLLQIHALYLAFKLPNS